MFKREIQSALEQWKVATNRKPLIVRGARQVGKTTAVMEFGKQFDNFLYFNLERRADQQLLETELPFDDLIRLLFARKFVSHKPGTTLFFIDEIQNSPKTMALLRYFYEEYPDIHVIVAGSLLENIVDIKSSFPVGRVDNLPVRPCSFREFVAALGKENLLQIVEEYPLHLDAMHNELMSLFQQYVIVGGMPEAVQTYVDTRDVLAIDRTYETLLQSYGDDVEKYTRGKKLNEVVRFILQAGWQSAGETITMTNIGGSGYKSREVGEAFRLLEKAMLVELVHPTSSVQLPVLPDMKRAPKLIWLDTGLVNYASAIRRVVIGADDILDVWRGRIGEHVVAQELLTLNDKISQKRSFWAKHTSGQSAEVDFVWIVDSKLYPIEVKTGNNSKLRSLHSFIDSSPVDIGIRVWSGPFSVNRLTTTRAKKPFRLVNLPFYMVWNLETVIRDVEAGKYD